MQINYVFVDVPKDTVTNPSEAKVSLNLAEGVWMVAVMEQVPRDIPR